MTCQAGGVNFHRSRHQLAKGAGSESGPEEWTNRALSTVDHPDIRGSCSGRSRTPHDFYPSGAASVYTRVFGSGPLRLGAIEGSPFRGRARPLLGLAFRLPGTRYVKQPSACWIGSRSPLPAQLPGQSPTRNLASLGLPPRPPFVEVSLFQPGGESAGADDLELSMR